MSLLAADPRPPQETLPASRQRRRATTWLLTSWTAVALCAAVPIVVLALRHARLPGVLTLLTLGLTIYAGARLSILVWEEKVRPFAGLAWLFVYVAAGVAPLCQLATGESELVQDRGLLLPATIMIWVAVLSYDVGAWLFNRRPEPAVPPPARVLSVRRLKWLSVLTLVVTAYAVQKTGGVGAQFLNRQDAADLGTSLGITSGGQATSAIFGAAESVLPLMMLLAWLSVFLRSRGARSGSNTLWLVVYVAVNVIVNNPLPHSRYWMLTVIVGILFMVPGMTYRRFQAVLVGGVVLALLVFPKSDVFRLNSAHRGDAIRSDSISETLAIKDYDQTVMTANGMWWVNDVRGHTLGRQALGDLLFWLPRADWPGKPHDTGTDIGVAMQTSIVQNVNLSSPLWLELWVDFSYLGVVAGFLLLGYWSRRLDLAFARRRNRARRETLLIDIAVPVLAGYQFIILRGSLLQAMGRLAFILLALALLHSRQAEPE